MKSGKWHWTGQGAIPARCFPWPAGCTGAAEHRWILSPDSKHRKGHPCPAQQAGAKPTLCQQGKGLS